MAHATVIALAIMALVVMAVACERTPPEPDGSLREAVAADDRTAVRGHIHWHPDTIDDRDRNGETVLHESARLGHRRITRLLIDAGADVNAASRFSETPLFHASAEGHARIVGDLLAHGGDHTVENIYGETALHHAARHGHLDATRALIDAGADPFNTDQDGLRPYDRARQNEFDEVEAYLADVMGLDEDEDEHN